MSEPKYHRVLLKISGEALAGEAHRGLDFDVIGGVCDVVKKCVEAGVQIGIVVGGGNFWRGLKDGGDRMERTRADHMGMLATVHQRLSGRRLPRAARRGGARADGHRHEPDRRALHPQQGHPASGEGPRRDLRLRHRQPVLLDRYGRCPARGRDQRGRDPACQEHRRRLLGRSRKGPDGRSATTKSPTTRCSPSIWPSWTRPRHPFPWTTTFPCRSSR